MPLRKRVWRKVSPDFTLPHWGHPCPNCDLMRISADHSYPHCLHFHQTCLWDPAWTQSGVNGKFFSQFHSSAREGDVVSKSLKPGRTFCPEQNGQPRPFALLSTIAGHSCPHWPIHHTFLLEWAVTSQGDRSPFLVGCHYLAKLGLQVNKSFWPFISLVVCPIMITPITC